MAADEFDAKKIADWLSPAEAIALLNGDSPYIGDVVSTIGRRLYVGLITAVAKDAAITDGKKVRKHSYYKIPGVFWHLIRESDEVWRTADLSVLYRPEDGVGKEQANFFGIRFNPADIREIESNFRKPSSRKHIAIDSANKGGRPPKEFWDDLWVEMCRLIHEEGLAPKTQADLARVMHQWLQDNGHDAGETAVKERARKLFNGVKW
ncbi:MAG: hypothetical protein AB7O46_05030 [Xanthobacteraceae bacterium]